MKDLAKNQKVCPPATYTAPVTKPQRAYIRPLKSERPEKPVVPAPDTSVVTMQDKDWSRPPLVMLEEVLRREVNRARIYQEVSLTPAPEDIIVEPTLLGLIGAWEQMLETKSRTYATIAFQVKVFGPADASGKRALWMDEKISEHVASLPTTGTPPPIPILTGTALSQLMNRLLGELYQADGPMDPAKKAKTEAGKKNAAGKKNG